MQEKLAKIREKIKIERCCCCADLQTGCYILGALDLIFTIFRIYIIVKRTRVSGNSAITYYDIEYKVCYIVITSAISGALIWGAHKLRKIYLIPWLVLRLVEIVLLLIIAIIVFILIFFTDELAETIVNFIVYIIGVGIMCYLWMCVWSFYHKMGDNEIKKNAVGPAIIDDIDKESHMS